MKCKHCDGTGKSNMYKDGEFVDCMYCGGTGEIEVEMTNEEWRKACSTEEFAEFLSDVVFNAIVDYQIDKNNCEKEDGNYWLKWLKRPHNRKDDEE